MNHREIDALMAGMAPVVRDLVNQVVAEAVDAILPKLAASAAETINAELARAVGAFPKPQDGKDADPAVIERMVTEAVAKNADPEQVGALVSAEVERAVAALPKPENGKDADPDVIASMVADAVAKLPPAPAGKDADPEQVAAVVKAEVERAVAALPKAENGKDADPAVIERMVADAVAKLPPAPAGKDADPERIVALVSAEVERVVAALPEPKNGKDGVGLAGAIIGRDGNLIVTLTDGSQRDLGLVVGKDADRAEMERFIREKVAEIPAPKDGKDGLGFDDLNVEYDGGREFTLRFVRGETVKEFKFNIPVVIDRGIWREGDKCAAGDGKTFGGSFWIAQKDTTAKPGESDHWRLSVKRGRDGKDGSSVTPSAPKPISLR